MREENMTFISFLRQINAQFYETVGVGEPGKEGKERSTTSQRGSYKDTWIFLFYETFIVRIHKGKTIYLLLSCLCKGILILSLL